MPMFGKPNTVRKHHMRILFVVLAFSAYVLSYQLRPIVLGNKIVLTQCFCDKLYFIRLIIVKFAAIFIAFK